MGAVNALTADGLFIGQTGSVYGADYRSGMRMQIGPNASANASLRADNREGQTSYVRASWISGSLPEPIP